MVHQEIKFCQHLRSISIGGKMSLFLIFMDSAIEKIDFDLNPASQIMENILGISPIEFST